MLNDFIQKYYLPPVGVTPENRVFSPTHIIISSILILIVFCVYYSVLKKRSQPYAKKVLLISAFLMLILEVFRIWWNAYYHGLSLDNLRFDFCNQICIALPLIVLTGNEKAYPYINLLAIAGGFIVLIYPLWVFYDYAGFHLLALQSLTSHALMLLCGLIMPYASGYNPDRHTGSRDSLIGFSIILIVAFIASYATGVNYLLMLGANGVPILQDIPFPYYWIPFLIFVYTASYFLSWGYHNLVCYTYDLPNYVTHLYDNTAYHRINPNPKTIKQN